MNNYFIGIALILTSATSSYSMYVAIKDKSEPWWLRLIEFVFAFFFLIGSLSLASFLQK
jgi:hypothetical protein